MIAAMLVVIDILCLSAALLAAHALRFGSVPDSRYVIGIVASAIPWVMVFYVQGLYAPQHLSAHEDFRRTVSAVAVGIVLVILLSFWFDVYLSRSWMALTFVIALILELAARGILTLHVERMRGRNSLVLRTLIIGVGQQTADLATTLARPGSGFHPLGCIDARDLFNSPDGRSPAHQVEHLRNTFRDYRLDCLFIASPTIGSEQMIAMMRAARQEGITVRVNTNLSGILASRVSVQPVGKDGLGITLRPARLSAGQRLAKRGLDIGLACVGLVVSSPIFLLVALAVKATSRGPVFYSQARVTEGGRTFRMYKFRTMSMEADRYVEEQSIDTSRPFFKLQQDPRLTSVGRHLRNLSLDELPQLWNVLLGDMSLVGPRPLPAEQVSANLELLGPRHEVRAGVTGWWQIRGRANLDSEEAIRMDHFYIENWSPALDVYILLKTIGVVLRRSGAR